MSGCVAGMIFDLSVSGCLLLIINYWDTKLKMKEPEVLPSAITGDTLIRLIHQVSYLPDQQLMK